MPLFTAGQRKKLRHRRVTQQRSWLRLPFLRRGNRVVRRPDQSDRHAVPDEAGDGATLPNGVSAKVAATARRGLLRGFWLGLWRAALALVLCVVAAAGLYGARHLLRTRPEFAVRAVRVSPTTHVRAEQLLALGGVAPGQNLFAVDLGEVRARVAAEPWLRSVRVQRELPATISIVVEEHEPAALIALESLYLVSTDGVVFKRATPDEALGRPVITGLGREFFLEARDESQSLIREALDAERVYREAERRPPLGELHVDAIHGLLLYTQSGTAIRLGRGQPAELRQRLARLDAVLAALGREPAAPQAIYLDNRAHPEHVTVRLASTAKP